MEWMSGPYASYIWPAYLVAVLVIGGLVGASLRAYARAKAALGETERKRGPRGEVS